MKTKEELNALKEEVKAVNKKLAELTEDELAQVSGGANANEIVANAALQVSENVQAAESAIRDADMAKEMTEYTKNNILLNPGKAKLEQANQLAHGVQSLTK